MAQVHFLLVSDQDTDDKNITVFVSGAEAPFTAHNSHPNFDKILEGAIAGDPEVVSLFDVGETVGKYFEALSERVAVSNGHIFFDGDEVDNALTRQVVRFLEEDVDDWEPLVNFFENVSLNPNEHSRTQLYAWLDKHDFTIAHDGYLIAYKGVASDGNDGYRSLHSGYGIVNGKVYTNSYIPNAVGDVIEIPRSMVQVDPAKGCAVGMHVGTYEYAKGYASQGLLLKVLVNPRDVVSVPTDCNAQKVRVCRYEVLDSIQEKITSAYDAPEFETLDDEDPSCDCCDDGGVYCDGCDPEDD